MTTPKQSTGLDPFSWFTERSASDLHLSAERVMESVGKIRDLTGEIAALSKILEREVVEQESGGGRCLLSATDRGDLFRLLVSVSRSAADETSELVEWIDAKSEEITQGMVSGS